MRVLGVLLMIIGLAWVVLCFVGMAMMSRSVDFMRETLLPSLPGFILVGAGFYLTALRGKGPKV